jgi:hypothetical protein
VVEALTAAKKVEVELVKIASVAVREAMKAFVKVSPVPEILVVEAVFKVVCPETVREVAEAVVRVVCPETERVEAVVVASVEVPPAKKSEV